MKCCAGQIQYSRLCSVRVQSGGLRAGQLFAFVPTFMSVRIFSVFLISSSIFLVTGTSSSLFALIILQDCLFQSGSQNSRPCVVYVPYLCCISRPCSCHWFITTATLAAENIWRSFLRPAGKTHNFLSNTLLRKSCYLRDNLRTLPG
jgi:hypothetical protein